MPDVSLINRRKRQAVRTLQLDRATIEIVQALTSSDVPCLLLKGASIATWLYPNEFRPYVDVDVLVPRSLWDQAVQQIEQLGFILDLLSPTGGNWYRAKDRVWLDLHYTLAGLLVPDSLVWTHLWSERENMPLHGVPVPILNERARLFHVVMHAIQTGNAKTKAAEDLLRAVATVPFAYWQAAWALAKALQAEQRFATSLRLYAVGGDELADRLGAPRHVPFLQAAHAIERAPGTFAVTALIEGNWRTRLALLKRWAWPGKDLLMALQQGKVAQVPPWIQGTKSWVVKFYLWRG
jgi:hypothetical protein